MKIFKNIAELRKKIKKDKKDGKKIALVPTMGYLHKGHLSLIELAKKYGQIVVLSIFVNPIQFGEGEDLDKYPRDFERDESLALKSGVDYIFYPNVKEMYPDELKSYVDVKDLTNTLCGEKRPGHFKGVTTVVTKLFNIVMPDFAVFGQKDAQQLRVIEKMVKDLNFDIEIIRGKIVREEDGLAMSSRNKYLTSEEREEAIALRKAIKKATELILSGEKRVINIKEKINGYLRQYPNIKIDYFEIVDFETLELTEDICGELLIAGAIYLGKTRLIDNMILKIN